MTELGRVLIAEDDTDIASTLARGMAREGYEPVIAHDAAEALAAAREAPFDAAVIDMMLGSDRGEALARRLRGQGMAGPILMLSALSGVEDRAEGMAAGADDYIAKPFEFRELMTRLALHARLRARAREGAGAEGGVAFGGFRFDPRLREVRAGESRVSLTQREGDLLSFLASQPNTLVSRGEIFDTLWAGEGGSSENVVDVYIGYLRRKLAQCEGAGVQIRTIRGRGFMLTDEVGD